MLNENELNKIAQTIWDENSFSQIPSSNNTKTYKLTFNQLAFIDRAYDHFSEKYNVILSEHTELSAPKYAETGWNIFNNYFRRKRDLEILGDNETTVNSAARALYAGEKVDEDRKKDKDNKKNQEMLKRISPLVQFLGTNLPSAQKLFLRFVVGLAIRFQAIIEMLITESNKNSSSDLARFSEDIAEMCMVKCRAHLLQGEASKPIKDKVGIMSRALTQKEDNNDAEWEKRTYRTITKIKFNLETLVCHSPIEQPTKDDTSNALLVSERGKDLPSQRCNQHEARLCAANYKPMSILKSEDIQAKMTGIQDKLNHFESALKNGTLENKENALTKLCDELLELHRITSEHVVQQPAEAIENCAKQLIVSTYTTLNSLINQSSDETIRLKLKDNKSYFSIRWKIYDDQGRQQQMSNKNNVPGRQQQGNNDTFNCIPRPESTFEAAADGGKFGGLTGGSGSFVVPVIHGKTLLAALTMAAKGAVVGGVAGAVIVGGGYYLIKSVGALYKKTLEERKKELEVALCALKVVEAKASVNIPPLAEAKIASIKHELDLGSKGNLKNILPDSKRRILLIINNHTITDDVKIERILDSIKLDCEQINVELENMRETVDLSQATAQAASPPVVNAWAKETRAPGVNNIVLQNNTVRLVK